MTENSNNELPKIITIGACTYGILSILKDGEGCINGKIMTERAIKNNAHLGVEDCEFILKHQKDIPDNVCKNAVLVFTNYSNPHNADEIGLLVFIDGEWGLEWYPVDCDDWRKGDYILHRI